jgi:hypothetical protein
MSTALSKLMLGFALTCAGSAAAANVIVDWDGKAVGVIARATPAPLSQREAALVNIAMFDAVNAIDRHYRPYLVELTVARTTSSDATAAAAAATMLRALHPEASGDIKVMLDSYLAAIPDGEAKAEGVKLGEAVANKAFHARASDGATAPDAYRPNTRPGLYIPTAITAGWSMATMKPFVLTKPSQFRPGPPPTLDSKEWAADYNEIKNLGGKASTVRSACAFRPWRPSRSGAWRPPIPGWRPGVGVRATHRVELVISVLSRSVKRDVARPGSQ